MYPFIQEAVLKEGYLVKAPDVSKYVHNFKVSLMIYYCYRGCFLWNSLPSSVVCSSSLTSSKVALQSHLIPYLSLILSSIFFY